ncbi:MAG: BamA/TamA family outer membrane protein [bacterium]
MNKTTIKKILTALPAFALCMMLYGVSAAAQDAPAAAVPAPNENITAQGIADETDVIIKKIDVTGNFEVPDDEILSAVVSKEGEKLSTTKLEEDLQRIFDLGYFAEDVKASLSEFDNGAKVTFRVKENPVINDISFEGNTSLTTAALTGIMTSKKNAVLNSVFLKKDVEAIEAKYHEEGFVAARVINVPVDQDRNLKIVISEGTIQAIKVVFVTKNQENPEDIQTLEKGKTKPNVVIREMRIKPGDTYNTKMIGKDLQRVYNLGFFEDVHTRVDAGEKPGEIILVVEVEEAKTGQAGFGAGYSSNTGLTGFLSYSERNLKGKGRRTDIKLEFGGKRNNIELGYFEPWLDRKQTSLEVNVYSTSRENLRYGLGGEISPDYQEIRTGFNFTFGRPISDYTRVFAGLKFENINVDPEAYHYLNGSSRSVTSSIRTDTRDFVFNPTTGRFDSLSVELNGGPLGGKYDYQKVTFDVRRFYPVRKKQVFAARANFGAARGSIPRFDWFDLGGVNSLRGYEEYEFSGTIMALYNVEYRFTMSGNLSLVAFGDAGNCWTSRSEVKILPGNGMKRSFGIGLRLKIPQFGIGPIRLDYAIALNPQQNKIHFGFGHMF